MELTKLEAYNISDETSNGWKSQGLVVKELDGSLKINFTTQGGDRYIGSYNYNSQINSENINVNITSTKGYEEEFAIYAQEIINQVLELLK